MTSDTIFFDDALARSGFVIGLFVMMQSASATSLSIQSTVNGSLATVTASDNYGGAITSFSYRGVEYIDTYDHGRELQSAVSFNGWGECYNPTEAGNNHTNPPVSSQLQSWSNQGGILATSTRMAFWLQPGESGYCGNGVTSAVNTTVFSNDIFQKYVSFGLSGIPNVLSYQQTFNVNEPAQRSSGVFEALTAYMPSSFNTFLTFEPRTSTLSQLPLNAPGCPGGSTCTYQPLPVIVATQDGLNAMAVYSPVAPTGQYGTYKWTGTGATSKWNCVFGEGTIPATSTYTYHCNVAFGTVEEVTNALRGITVGLSNTLVPEFRFFDGTHHFITPSYSEAASLYWSFEKTAFRVFTTPQDSNMVALYRCYSPSSYDHFVSLSSNCEGQNYEGLYGYVSSIPRTGYEEIYRFYKSSIGDHLITTDSSEGTNNGYQSEGSLGFAPIANY